MRWNGWNVLRAELLATGLLLTMTPSGLAQTTLPDTIGGSQGGPMLPDNDQPPGMDQAIFVNLRRNIVVEMQLSQLALTHSGNADVRSFAQQVISENRKLEARERSSESEGFTEPFGRSRVTLPASSDSLVPASYVPEQTRQAEQRMKKLSDLAFDRVYLVQMDAYIKDDGLVARRASAVTSSPDAMEIGMRERNLGDERAQEITQLAAGENFKIQ